MAYDFTDGMDSFAVRDLLACYARGVFPMADSRDACLQLIGKYRDRHLADRVLTRRALARCLV